MNPLWSVRVQIRSSAITFFQIVLIRRYFDQIFVTSVIFLRWSHSNSARFSNRRMHQSSYESISLFCSVRSLTATAIFLCCLHRNLARFINESISLSCFAVLQQSSFFCVICIQIRHVFNESISLFCFATLH